MSPYTGSGGRRGVRVAQPFSCTGDELMRVMTAIVAIVLAGVVSGCAAGRGAGGIPLGEWEGPGLYTRSGGNEDTPGFVEGEDARRVWSEEYRTSLSIRAVGERDDAVELRVRSRHPDDERFEGKDVWVALRLERGEETAEGATVYRVVRGEIDLNVEGPGEELDEVDPPMTALLLTRGGERELLLSFAPEMQLVEVFRFRRGEVVKTGSFCDRKEVIHWQERLQRK